MLYLAYRGQHCGAKSIRGRLPSLTFGPYEVARIYATTPNEASDPVIQPTVFEVKLEIRSPFVDQEGDGFIDFEDFRGKLGYHAEAFITRYGIESGCIQLWRLFDDYTFVDLLVKLGYDGAIYMGSGVGASTLEYRVLSESQVTVVEATLLEIQ